MKNPELLIQVDNSMPIGELIEDNNSQDVSIKRSAHVGNMFGADLILTSLGMNTILVDANYGLKDKLYFPQYIVDEDQPLVQVASPEALSLANTANCGQALTDKCTESLVDAFGNTSVIADKDFVAENQEFVERLVSILLDEFSTLFARRIDSLGRPYSTPDVPKNIEDVLLLGEDRMRGAVLPNEITILIDFLVEALKYQTGEITHISGPTMILYVLDKTPCLNAMYQKLVASGLKLPERLTVRLIPAAGVRFVVAAAQAETMDEMLDMQAELNRVSTESSIARKLLATSATKPTKLEFDALGLPKKSLEKELGRLLHELPQLFFVASEQANTPTFTSQYTALRNGADGTAASGLYIPKFAIEQPINEVSARFKQLELLRKKV